VPALSMAAKRDSMKLAASRTDALAIVGKKTEKDDSTSAAEKYFGEKDDSSRKSLPAVNIFPVGPARVNCMLVLDVRESPARLNIVNPGADFEEIMAELKGMIADLGVGEIQLDHILISHAHVNTFSVANRLLALGDGVGHIVLHEADKFLWDRWETQIAELGLEQLDAENVGQPTMLLSQPDTYLQSGLMKIRCLHTPGVSPGSTCYFFDGIDVVYSGCVLLANAVGRTSWIGIRSLDGTANARVLRRSIDEVLIDKLEPDVQVVPAFGPLSTIRNELHLNGHLKVLSHRWLAYDDIQAAAKRREQAALALAADPQGDGLPF
jgi:hydroxyacylglutathione hydrolase